MRHAASLLACVLPLLATSCARQLTRIDLGHPHESFGTWAAESTTCGWQGDEWICQTHMADDAYWWSAWTGPAVSGDLEIEARLRFVDDASPNQFSIAIGDGPFKRQLLLSCAIENGRARVSASALHDGRWEQVIAPTFPPGLELREPTSLVLRISGAEVTAYVNDERVGSGRSPISATGGVRIVLNAKTHVAVRRLTVREAGGLSVR